MMHLKPYLSNMRTIIMLMTILMFGSLTQPLATLAQSDDATPLDEAYLEEVAAELGERIVRIPLLPGERRTLVAFLELTDESELVGVYGFRLNEQKIIVSGEAIYGLDADKQPLPLMTRGDLRTYLILGAETESAGESAGLEAGVVEAAPTWSIETGVEQLSPELQEIVDANPNLAYQIADWDVIFTLHKAPLLVQYGQERGMTRWGYYTGPEFDFWEAFAEEMLQRLLLDGQPVLFLNKDTGAVETRSFEAYNLPPMMIEIRDKSQFPQDVEDLGGTAGKVTDSSAAPNVVMRVIEKGQVKVLVYVPHTRPPGTSLGADGMILFFSALSGRPAMEIARAEEFNYVGESERMRVGGPVNMTAYEAESVGLSQGF